MSFRFVQPNNEDDFELFCLRFLRQVWKCDTLALYGKRGERQDGIDIIDEAGTRPARAVQCKFHEAIKTLPPAEIKAEFAKLKESPLRIDEYHILTTARKTREAQNAAIQINADQDNSGGPKLFVWYWSDKIETLLSEMDDETRDRVIQGDSGRSITAVGQVMLSTLTNHLDRPLYASASVLDGELDAIKALIDRHENEVAEHKIVEIESRAADNLQNHHRYNLAVHRAQLLMDKGEWLRAGQVLLDAMRFQQTTDRARINEALGYELLGQKEKAHGIASDLRKQISHSEHLIALWVRTAPDSGRTHLIAG